ncbi:MAG: hypothetical protein FRX48_07413 [Lasallia pustulata]|uniref:Uncharacterized protein n=1 Tax=Lasallia pustulata TaxID=136370 RepID=A0A5M8PI48_9LECA|nr:MAG: hypothetical protein FRX48_07413 [Lasallia pustulata]
MPHLLRPHLVLLLFPLLATLTSAALLPTHPLLLRDPATNPLTIRHPSAQPTTRKPTTCPNYATSPINPAQFLGAEPNGCSWKGALICANLLVGCPVVCIEAALEVG